MNLSFSLDFIAGLAQNNNREYFQEHKAEYEKSHEQMLEATQIMINEISLFDENVSRLQPKDCLFRIYRDVRFSPDKAPYKRHFGTYVCAKGGRKSMLAGYYLHIESGRSMLMGGLYCLPTNLLRMVREEIIYNLEPLEAILNEPKFKERMGNMYALESLKKLPQGVPDDFPHKEWIKFKNFIAGVEYSDDEVRQDDFMDKVIADCRLLTPFNAYMNDIIWDEL